MGGAENVVRITSESGILLREVSVSRDHDGDVCLAIKSPGGGETAYVYLIPDQTTHLGNLLLAAAQAPAVPMDGAS